MSDQKLIVMRHAKSDWAAAPGTDIERQLNRRGRNDALRMGRYLRELEVAPSCIKTSPARRAAETADIVAETLDALPIISEPSLYLADLNELIEVVRRPPNSCWVLIGHNPGLESLLEFLDPGLEGRIEFSKFMPTAAIYAFDVEMNQATLHRGCGTLLFHQRPKLLDSKFSFELNCSIKKITTGNTSTAITNTNHSMLCS